VFTGEHDGFRIVPGGMIARRFDVESVLEAQTTVEGRAK
jgi:hypothetical protein